MESSDVTKMANQMAMALKKAKKNKKTKNVSFAIEQAEQAIKACAVLGRIMKLAESDAEVANPGARLSGEEAGRAEVWGLVIRELDELSDEEE